MAARIMLKRLLNRGNTSQTVAEAAADTASSTPAAPGAATASSPAPVLKPKRNTKSMRDSDIKDELGRSAEQIAAGAKPR